MQVDSTEDSLLNEQLVNSNPFLLQMFTDIIPFPKSMNYRSGSSHGRKKHD